jgi:anti-sigma factor RsiW
MDCRMIAERLLAYHFATATDEERASVEAHLCACSDCVRAYVVLKHELERVASTGDKPSEAMRQRLRAEVERTFKRSAPARLRRWLGRPIPLYQGLAAAALVLFLAAVGPSLLQRVASPVGSGPYVDTSRSAPESLYVY